MRTPEEIKRGLECCIDGDCDSCPYYEAKKDCGDRLKLDALAYIRQLEDVQPKWISVEERLPEDRVDVIVYTNLCGGYTDYAYYRYDRCAWFKNCIQQIYNVTYWMPLPETPKEG